MAINLGEILALLAKLEALGEITVEAWKNLQEHAAQEADEKKRRKLIEAITSRDVDAIRAVLFSVDN
jgi:hypothetical protein